MYLSPSRTGGLNARSGLTVTPFSEQFVAAFTSWVCFGLCVGNSLLYLGTFGLLAGIPWIAGAFVAALAPMAH